MVTNGTDVSSNSNLKVSLEPDQASQILASSVTYQANSRECCFNELQGIVP